MRRYYIILFALLLAPQLVLAQAKRTPKKPVVTPAAPYDPLQIFGIRPGVSLDSIRKLIKEAGTVLREVPQDTLTRSFGDQTVKVYVVDSIICRLTYMRMVFIVDA